MPSVRDADLKAHVTGRTADVYKRQVLGVIFAGCFGGLWWRLGAGPINLDLSLIHI